MAHTIQGFEIKDGKATPDTMKKLIEAGAIPFKSVDNKELEPKPKEEVKKYTEKELIAMNKSQQTLILREFGIIDIPSIEKERVKKILEMQR